MNYRFNLVKEGNNINSYFFFNLINFLLLISVTLAEHAADDLRLQEEENKNLEPLKGVELKLYTPGQSLSNSDDEMDKFSASRRTSLSRRVEGIFEIIFN